MRDYELPSQLKSASEAHSRGIPVLGAAGHDLSEPSGPSPLLGISMRELAENIERLQHSIQSLQSKLEPVLYAEPPTPARENPVVQTRSPRACSDLGSAINALADQVENINDRVRAIVRRCEL